MPSLAIVEVSSYAQPLTLFCFGDLRPQVADLHVAKVY